MYRGLMFSVQVGYQRRTAPYCYWLMCCDWYHSLKQSRTRKLQFVVNHSSLCPVPSSSRFLTLYVLLFRPSDALLLVSFVSSVISSGSEAHSAGLGGVRPPNTFEACSNMHSSQKCVRSFAPEVYLSFIFVRKSFRMQAAFPV